MRLKHREAREKGALVGEEMEMESMHREAREMVCVRMPERREDRGGNCEITEMGPALMCN